MNIPKARLDGLYMLLLGGLVFTLLGVVLAKVAQAPTTDFRPLYYSTRCLLQGHDAYQASEVHRVYQADAAYFRFDTAESLQIATQNVYPPTSLIYIVPLAMLPWGIAQTMWMFLSLAGMMLAAYLMWDIGAEFSPILSGVLLGFLLANSEILVVTGNVAGIAISLCVVAVWSFFRERFIWAGIVCMAVSLALKPHDAGFVWLFFLLAGGVYRRRAMQTFFLSVVLAVPGVLWVWRVSPHWMQELHFNLLAYSLRGGTNDPIAAAMGPKGVIDLQSVISYFWSDPRIYNPVSYLLCLPILIVWMVVTRRRDTSQARTWLALASISAFTMLPVYHRQYDAKLLLLTVPACAILWARGGRMGQFSVLVNAALLVVTGDLSWVFLLGLIHKLNLSHMGIFWNVLITSMRFSAPLMLLATSVFYLWVYERSSRDVVECNDLSDSGG